MTSIRSLVVLAALAASASSIAAPTAPAAVLANTPWNMKWDGRSGPLLPLSEPPAATVDVLDIRRASPEWQRAALTLQGLVNRTRPSIYCLVSDTDQEWLDRMVRAGAIRRTRSAASPMELIRRHRGLLRGVEIVDPDLLSSVNVAYMLASVENGLPVSADMVKTLGLPVLHDLRGKWKTNAAAYQWAFDNLWPKLGHSVMSFSAPHHTMPRDYLVQHKAFQFWITGPVDGVQRGANPTAEARVMQRVLAKAPANIAVLGYPYAGENVGIQETPGVSLISKYAKYLVATDFDSNLSLHSGIRIPPLRQRHPAPPKLDRSKVYVTFTMSDGDNLQVYQQRSFQNMWASPLRGSIPVGWTISPSAARLIPFITRWFYQRATPADEFIAAVSGVGYMYPDDYAQAYRAQDRRRVYNGFMAETGSTMRAMDMRDIWIMGATRADAIAPYAEQIPGLSGIFPDYGRRAADYAHATYPTSNGVPVFHCVDDWGAPEHVALQVRAMAPPTRPAFMHIFAQNWGADLPKFAAVMKALGPGFIAVRPDHLSALYRQDMRLRKVEVQGPPSVTAMQGHGADVEFAVRNLTGRTIAAMVSASGAGSGFHGGEVSLRPYATHTVRLPGVSRAGRISVTARGAFGVVSASTTARVTPASELTAPLPKGALRFVRRYDAVSMPHRAGRDVADPGASSGRSWVTVPGPLGNRDAGMVVYGPYVTLPKGRYVAVFRLKRTGPGTGPVVRLDATVDGGNRTLAAALAPSDALPENEWRSIPLNLNYPGGVLETRIDWLGSAPLAIDGITLYEEAGSGR
ncbi:MAG TPA: GxGYxYP domain-containing protein [Armatimonadota bacterium]|jgi:hypothetical protein